MLCLTTLTCRLADNTIQMVCCVYGIRVAFLDLDREDLQYNVFKLYRGVPSCNLLSRQYRKQYPRLSEIIGRYCQL